MCQNERIRGRIQKALSGFYYVKTADGSLLQCRARGKFRQDGCSPLVGDWVTVQTLGGGEGFVEQIEARRNSFSRPAVANLDQLVVVASAATPVTDPFFIDRMSAVAVLKGCRFLLCINKCDLDPAFRLREIYAAAGIPLLAVSAQTGEGLDGLEAELSGKLSAFTGNSGVGKSSLLNALDPQFHLATGQVSQALGRGRHTTRHIELYTLSSSAEIIDTPGFGAFDSGELNWELKRRLPETFPDFAPYLSHCRFEDCRHTGEAGCAVAEAAAAGRIHPSRLESYRRLYAELKQLKDWEEPGVKEKKGRQKSPGKAGV